MTATAVLQQIICKHSIRWAAVQNLSFPFFYDLAHGYEVPKDKLYRFQPSWEFADYMKLNNDIDPTPFLNLYYNCVAEADSLVGCVLHKLEEKKLLDNTLVIITGDHGQEFNENHKIIGATAVIIHRYKHISPSYYMNRENSHIPTITVPRTMILHQP